MSSNTAAVVRRYRRSVRIYSDPSNSGPRTELAERGNVQPIGAIYLAAYDDVIAALTDRPESTEATEQLTTLKDGYIEQLVELGQQREALDASGRATVDATIMSAVMSLPGETLTEYPAAIDHYVVDTELDKLIRSFNVIGQYANFDLLREQEPDEATRLGIG